MTSGRDFPGVSGLEPGLDAKLELEEVSREYLNRSYLWRNIRGVSDLDLGGGGGGAGPNFLTPGSCSTSVLCTVGGESICSFPLGECMLFESAVGVVVLIYQKG